MRTRMHSLAGTVVAALILSTGVTITASHPADAAAPNDSVLASAVASPTRTAAFVARDKFRHPLEALSFWRLKPGETVLEIWPSGGYWTEILAPYAKATGGKYIAGLSSPQHPLPARFSNQTLYGAIGTAYFNETSGPLAAPGSVDLILTVRNLHDWVRTPGMPQKAFADFFAVLKPGGILGVVDHRADPRAMVKDASDGYVSTAYVVKLAENAGFRLDGQSEINANPKDTKDYPFGVWTLPPSRQSAPGGQPANPAFDRAKYDAIGESDRMTLRFVKPG